MIKKDYENLLKQFQEEGYTYFSWPDNEWYIDYNATEVYCKTCRHDRGCYGYIVNLCGEAYCSYTDNFRKPDCISILKIDKELFKL